MFEKYLSPRGHFGMDAPIGSAVTAARNNANANAGSSGDEFGDGGGDDVNAAPVGSVFVPIDNGPAPVVSNFNQQPLRVNATQPAAVNPLTTEYADQPTSEALPYLPQQPAPTSNNNLFLLAAAVGALIFLS